MIAAAVFVFNFLVNLRLKQINLPATWKVIKQILKPNSKKQNDFQIEENGTKLSDSTEIANALNEYFSSVAPSLAAQIPDVGIDPLSYIS